ncbi:hypothetical protein [Dictyobacter kobayashii]|uniref:ABC transporter permease n=1 Tax=Dictyobacter kobayashii TaxID=2014872 RepID=A0A402AYZ1_9CHLR|nr:hypothetical protein [Dictyobacter kobayashii]GCE24275.1 hypothetical protein KDK_80750 [Dictyobacter kobayashii]
MAQISSGSKRTTLQELWARNRGLIRQQVPLLVFIILFVFSSIRYDGFLSNFNLTTFFSYNTIFVLLALGETFVIMTGELIFRLARWLRCVRWSRHA